MVWIRYGKIRAIWKCTTARGYDTKYHAVGVSIKDEYEKKPEEDIENWASILGDFVARIMCNNACGSLSTSVFCDEGSVQSETVYTSEMLVTKPGVKEEEKVIEKIKKVEIGEKLTEEEKKIRQARLRVPMYVLELIKFLETKKEGTQTKEGKDAVQKEIDSLKIRYGIV